MTREGARDLLLLVNTHDQYQRLLGYARRRIEALSKELQTEGDLERIRSIQGRIAELRRIETLRDEVIRAAEASN